MPETKPTEAMREAFEAYMRIKFPAAPFEITKRSPDDPEIYLYVTARHCWATWQAALASRAEDMAMVSELCRAVNAYLRITGSASSYTDAMRKTLAEVERRFL